VGFKSAATAATAARTNIVEVVVFPQFVTKSISDFAVIIRFSIGTSWCVM
jgi:hypothetical protein